LTARQRLAPHARRFARVCPFLPRFRPIRKLGAAFYDSQSQRSPFASYDHQPCFEIHRKSGRAEEFPDRQISSVDTLSPNPSVRRKKLGVTSHELRRSRNSQERNSGAFRDPEWRASRNSGLPVHKISNDESATRRGNMSRSYAGAPFRFNECARREVRLLHSRFRAAATP